MMKPPVPSELRLSADRRTLTVGYGDTSHALAAELLRVESPSAEVQGHDPSQKTLIGGKSQVAITRIEPVGNYAVRLVFDDGHETGIFSWAVLDRFVREGDGLWAAYVEGLAQAGLAR
ncbi:DUF971 domain-containing protein [Rhizobiaceae bacterium]|nr:DUF971 domain-containing protein [Rhizobiaceae bacterium]